MEDLTPRVRLNTQGAHAHEHLYLKMKPFYIYNTESKLVVWYSLHIPEHIDAQKFL